MLKDIMPILNRKQNNDLLSRSPRVNVGIDFPVSKIPSGDGFFKGTKFRFRPGPADSGEECDGGGFYIEVIERVAIENAGLSAAAASRIARRLKK